MRNIYQRQRNVINNFLERWVAVKACSRYLSKFISPGVCSRVNLDSCLHSFKTISISFKFFTILPSSIDPRIEEIKFYLYLQLFFSFNLFQLNDQIVDRYIGRWFNYINRIQFFFLIVWSMLSDLNKIKKTLQRINKSFDFDYRNFLISNNFDNNRR